MDLKSVNKRLHNFIALCIELMDTDEVERSWGCWESYDDKYAHDALRRVLADQLVKSHIAQDETMANDIINRFIEGSPNAKKAGEEQMHQMSMA